MSLTDIDTGAEADNDAPPPVVCDMTGATDTLAERMAEYQRLFAQALLRRSQTSEGIRFCFRADPGLEDWVRDLAAREKACCAFFSFTVTASAGEVWWDASVIDDDAARQVLAGFYRLPDTLPGTLPDTLPGIQPGTQPGTQPSAPPGALSPRAR